MSRINNYEELVAERRMLEIKITEQKEILNEDLRDVREKLEPLMALRPLLNMFGNKGNRPSLLQALLSTGIDLVAGQGLSPKINWLARLAISFVSKKIAERSAKNIKSTEYQPL